MEIRLLKKGYINNEQFYKDFLDGQIMNKEENFSEDVVYIDKAPDFPVYLNIKNEQQRSKLFCEAFDVMSKSYIRTDREIHLNEVFWHSLLTVYKRDFLLEQYPEIADDIKNFNNIVLKRFDWESYIYKCVLGAQYISDNVEDESQRQRYYRLIVDNLDVYNYIIKYEIFRNDKFLLNVLDIIDEYGLAKLLKAKIKDRPDLGKDERYGRRVIFEFNKSYPVVMSPMLTKEELEPLFFEYLSYYYDIRTLDLKRA